MKNYFFALFVGLLSVFAHPNDQNILEVITGQPGRSYSGYSWLNSVGYGGSNCPIVNSEITPEFSWPRTLIAVSPFTALAIASISTGALVYNKVSPTPLTSKQKACIGTSLGALCLYFLKPMLGGYYQGLANLMCFKHFNDTPIFNPWHSR